MAHNRRVRVSSSRVNNGQPMSVQKEQESDIVLMSVGGEDEELEVFSEDEDIPRLVMDLDPPVFNLDEMCRMCAKAKEESVKIFSAEGAVKQLEHKINTCLPIKVCQSDSLPLVLCTECITHLNNSYDVASTCLQAEETLKSLLQQQQQVFEQVVENNTSVNATFENHFEDVDSDICNDDFTATSPYPDSMDDRDLASTSNNTAKSSASGFLTKTSKPQQQKSDIVNDQNIPSTNFNCNYCWDEFDNSNEYIDHTLRDHKRHTCNICYMSFMSLNSLNNHNDKGHLLTKNIKRQHLHVEQPPNNEDTLTKPKHICNVCWKIFNDTDIFNKHCKVSCTQLTDVKHLTVLATEQSNSDIITTTDQNIWKIKKVGSRKKFGGKANKKKYFYKPKYTGQKINIVKQTGCKICNNDHVKYINNHYYIYHKRFACDICLEFYCDSSEKLKEHSKTHKQLPYPTQCNCDICDKKYYLKTNLRVHMKSHFNYTKNHKCKYCEKEFYRKKFLKTHLLSHTNKVKSHDLKIKDNTIIITKKLSKYGFVKSKKNSSLTSCKICTEKIPVNNIKYHYLRFHSAYKCNMCSFFSYDKDIFEIHKQQIHQLPSKSYHCNECSKSFKFKCNLKYHIRSNHISSSKKIVCDYCYSKFHFSSSLAKHLVRVHDFKKMFLCKMCNVSFFELKLMRSHQKYFHKYACEFCNVDYKTEQRFGNHFKTVHYNSSGLTMTGRIMV